MLAGYAEPIPISVSTADMFCQRKAGFKVDDEVTMRISKQVIVEKKAVTRHEWDAFIVADLRYHSSRWQYKLKDRKGMFYTESESWFPESRLKPM
jgi:hypothetical protein